MFRERSTIFSVILFLMLLICLITAACSGNEVSLPIPTETQVFSSGEDQIDPAPIMDCPAVTTRYLITYFHLEFLDLDPGTGETIKMTYESKPPGEIRVWIDSKGNITLDENNENITVVVSGENTYPDSAQCPVQKLSGIWELSTILTGVCYSGNIKIKIQHRYEHPYLESSCGELPPIIQSYISGPEHTLEFELADSIPSVIINYGEGTFYHVNYSYYFTPGDMFLQVPPLPETE